MTGTVDSSTTLRIRPAPPRGISTSTRPRARISALTESWLSPGTSWTTSAGSPAVTDGLAEDVDDGGVAGARARGPAQQDGVARLEADPGRVGGDVGPGLVDHPDDAEGHPQLAQLEPVGQRRPPDHLADRVGQPGDLAQPGGHRLEPVVGEAQPVDDVGGRARLLGATDVLGVGGQDRRRLRQQRVGHGVQGGVLRRAGGQRQVVAGGPRAGGDLADPGLVVRPVVGVLGAHASSVGRSRPPRSPVSAAGAGLRCPA